MSASGKDQLPPLDGAQGHLFMKVPSWSAPLAGSLARLGFEVPSAQTTF